MEQWRAGDRTGVVVYIAHALCDAYLAERQDRGCDPKQLKRMEMYLRSMYDYIGAPTVFYLFSI